MSTDENCKNLKIKLKNNYISNNWSKKKHICLELHTDAVQYIDICMSNAC